jgi:hypothetical protein
MAFALAMSCVVQLSAAATDGSNQVEFGLIPVELPGAVYDP